LSLPPELLSIPPISVPTSMERFSDAAAAGADDADAPASPVAIVVAPARALTGSLVKMDAAQSYDPHGGQLVYRWRQTGGPRVTKYSADERLGDAAPAFRPEEPGLYSFSLSVFNGTAGSEPIAIDVDVIAAPLVAPPSPVNVPPRPESDLRRVPELTPLPNSAPPPTIFPKVRIEDMKGRPAARILRGERRK
jgi:hypothetical protein